MASTRVGRVALISIRPRYAHAILDGRKTVEFRKRRLAEDVTHVVIYSTRPDRAVIGFFELGGRKPSRQTPFGMNFKTRERSLKTTSSTTTGAIPTAPSLR